MSTPAAKFCEFFVRWAAVSGALGPFGLPRLRPAGGAAAEAGRAAGRQTGFGPALVWKVLTGAAHRLHGPF